METGASMATAVWPAAVRICAASSRPFYPPLPILLRLRYHPRGCWKDVYLTDTDSVTQVDKTVTLGSQSILAGSTPSF
ncbi:hypothetical protein BV25DRAFT_1822280 [Artomyces pyxidatus]|uniref:Uncharacterized protein n=1 Tax=Artomyces pyxidatus TaxID=48021 RepID=A0ACB8TAF7_9AGAM|nr:hypothetical protein BV25DRAFT_1822280 [Artomyces pyxidatus]